MGDISRLLETLELSEVFKLLAHKYWQSIWYRISQYFLKGFFEEFHTFYLFTWNFLFAVHEGFSNSIIDIDNSYKWQANVHSNLCRGSSDNVAKVMLYGIYGVVIKHIDSVFRASAMGRRR